MSRSAVQGDAGDEAAPAAVRPSCCVCVCPRPPAGTHTPHTQTELADPRSPRAIESATDDFRRYAFDERSDETLVLLVSEDGPLGKVPRLLLSAGTHTRAA